ncbi:DUF4440 domain-containing protein [Streptomyces sp. INA 01156]
MDAAIEGELKLLDPEVRRSPERVGALLHPEFLEFGASGRIWTVTRSSPCSPTNTSRGPGRHRLRHQGHAARPDVVHLTFETDHNGRRARRSSLWRRTGQHWLLYFHQGTLFDPDEE